MLPYSSGRREGSELSIKVSDRKRHGTVQSLLWECCTYLFFTVCLRLKEKALTGSYVCHCPESCSNSGMLEPRIPGRCDTCIHSVHLKCCLQIVNLPGIPSFRGFCTTLLSSMESSFIPHLILNVARLIHMYGIQFDHIG